MIEAALAERKTVSMIYDEISETIPVSFNWFRLYVAREITGKAGSRGGRVAAKPPLPHKETSVDAPLASHQSTPQPLSSPEKSEQENGNPSQASERPKRIVTRVPDVDWLVHGIRREPKE